jgi:uncharacterized protein (DUF1684 family)
MKIILLLLISMSFTSLAQTSQLAAVEKFQRELNEEYKDPKKSPLSEKDRRHFKHHDFFPFDSTYCVKAELFVTEAAPFFSMPTSSFKTKEYRVYGILKFILKGKAFEIPVYQSQQLMNKEEYKDYLFFPFNDLTNGKSTYTAGRYIELHTPTEGNTIVLDFNQAFNPFCAYSNNYSCPIVPAANYIDMEIRAGIKYSGHKKK